ncbi:hypothetical protein Dimus_038485 [Dionaea muscipula]
MKEQQGVTMGREERHSKFYSVATTGQLFSRMPKHILRHVMRVREQGEYPKEMKCPLLTF